MKKWILCLVIGVVSTSLSAASPEITQVETKNKVPSKERMPNLYSPFLLRSLQIAFGSETIISQGGLESVDDLFSGTDLNGKSVLDVGCGFGGVDTYLAQQYAVTITAVDREPYMIQQAEKMFKSRTSPSLIGQVFFQTLIEPASLKEFPDHSFDIVFSKEILYHVSVEKKQGYINEMYRVLKVGGKILIADWAKGENLGERFKKAVNPVFCHLVTVPEYRQMLVKANFQNLTFRDVTWDHIQYCLNDIERIKIAKEQIQSELGEDSYNTALKNWNLQIDAMMNPPEFIACIFEGTKI